MNVLIVEDDDDLAQTLKDLLSLYDHEAHIVDEASKARDELEPGHRFDAAVFDVNLKDGNTIRLLKEIKERDDGLRVIAMTGGGPMAADVGVPLATIHGADAVLFKPFSNDEFLSAVIGE